MKISRHTLVLRLLQIFVGFVLLVYTLTWLLTPWLTRHFVADVLAPLDLALTEGSHVRYNPFLSSITVEKLAVLHDDKTIASLEAADIRFKLFRLPRKELYVKRFDVEGIYVDVDLNEGALSFGQYPLPEAAPATDEIPTEDDGVGAAWKVVLPSLSIRDVTIDFVKDQREYPIVIRELILSDLLASKANVQFSHDLTAELLGGRLEVNLSSDLASDTQQVDLNVALSNVSVEKIASFVEGGYGQVQGRVDVAFGASLSAQDKRLTIAAKDFEFALSKLEHSYQGVVANVQSLNVSIPESEFYLSDNALASYSLASNVSILGVQVSDGSGESQLLSFASFEVPFIRSNGAFSEVSEMFAEVNDVAFSDLHFSRVSLEESIPAFATLDAFTIDTVRYQDNKLALGEVLFSGLESHIYIDESGEISTLLDPPEFDASENEQGESFTEDTDVNEDGVRDSSEPEAVFDISVGKVAVSENSSVHFRDHSVTPHYVRDVQLDIFEITNINSRSNTLSPFSLIGRSNQYANFRLEGGVAPFAPKPHFDVKGEVKEVSLFSVSPYVRESLGFELNSGQLDTKINVQSHMAELDGKVTLRMRGLEMTAADNVESQSLADQSAVPLNVALGMLKDKRGNIKLNVPIKGSTDDPSFGVNSFLMLVTKKAVMSQAKNYLMKTFVPYSSVVSVALVAGEFALKLRFDDLVYAPTQFEVGDAHTEYAQQFVALMKEKEKTQVKICGVATPADAGLAPGVKIDDEAALSEVLNIAQQRSEVFKRYAVEVGGLESSRLLLCQPQIDFGEKAVPHISISL